MEYGLLWYLLQPRRVKRVKHNVLCKNGCRYPPSISQFRRPCTSMMILIMMIVVELRETTDCSDADGHYDDDFDANHNDNCNDDNGYGEYDEDDNEH